MITELNTKIFTLFSDFSFPGVGFVADTPIFFLPIFLLGMWLYHTFKDINNKKRHNLIHIFYACLIGIICSEIIKLFISIDRPDVYLDQAKSLIMSHIPEKSFPSDHATVSFAFVTALFYTGYRSVGYFFLPFVILMNISRIIVGVHWPLDILAGTILGILSSYVFFKHIVQLKLVKNVDVFIIKCMKYIKLY